MIRVIKKDQPQTADINFYRKTALKAKITAEKMVISSFLFGMIRHDLRQILILLDNVWLRQFVQCVEIRLYRRTEIHQFPIPLNTPYEIFAHKIGFRTTTNLHRKAFFGDLLPNEKSGSSQMAAVSSASGEILCCESEKLEIVSIDGKPPSGHPDDYFRQ